MAKASGKKPIRVLLVDDSSFFRQALRTILQFHKKILIVGEAGTRTDALTAIRDCRPDVVVLDIRLKDENGIALCREIRTIAPDISVLLLTVYEDKELFVTAVDAGAHAYV